MLMVNVFLARWVLTPLSFFPPQVTRITAESEALNVNITLDLANELIQFKPKEKFSLALARSLNPESDAEVARGGGDKSSEVKREMWRGGEQGLAEEYDYVMHGKVRARI
jgi:DNA-directed RNA polymerases I, II, and III subunit RPABC3